MHLTQTPRTTPSFAKSAIPLLLKIKPSRIALATIAVLHILALFALALADIPRLFEVVTVALVAISMGEIVFGTLDSLSVETEESTVNNDTPVY